MKKSLFILISAIAIQAQAVTYTAKGVVTRIEGGAPESHFQVSMCQPVTLTIEAAPSSAQFFLAAHENVYSFNLITNISLAVSNGSTYSYTPGGVLNPFDGVAFAVGNESLTESYGSAYPDYDLEYITALETPKNTSNGTTEVPFYPLDDGLTSEWIPDLKGLNGVGISLAFPDNFWATSGSGGPSPLAAPITSWHGGKAQFKHDDNVIIVELNKLKRGADAEITGIGFSDVECTPGSSIDLNTFTKTKVAHQAKLNAESFTAKARFRSSGATGNYQSVFTSRNNDNGDLYGYMLYITPGGELEAWVGSGDNSDWKLLRAPGFTMPSNQYVNATVRFKKTGINDNSGTLSLFVTDANGNDFSGVTSPASTSTNFSPATTNPLSVGIGGDTGTDYSLIGDVSLFEYYSRAIDSSALPKSITILDKSKELTLDY